VYAAVEFKQFLPLRVGVNQDGNVYEKYEMIQESGTGLTDYNRSYH